MSKVLGSSLLAFAIGVTITALVSFSAFNVVWNNLPTLIGLFMTILGLSCLIVSFQKDLERDSKTASWFILLIGLIVFCSFWGICHNWPAPPISIDDNKSCLHRGGLARPTESVKVSGENYTVEMSHCKDGYVFSI